MKSSFSDRSVEAPLTIIEMNRDDTAVSDLDTFGPHCCGSSSQLCMFRISNRFHPIMLCDMTRIGTW
jgi:hypothetical protein